MKIIRSFLGVGKTTFVKKIVQKLSNEGIKCHGFYTEELREGRTRTGFDIVTLDGRRGPLSRAQWVNK